ncbi:MAG: sigma-70 family RNA polymerase sigma factor [Planctomycetota bacterium]
MTETPRRSSLTKTVLPDAAALAPALAKLARTRSRQNLEPLLGSLGAEVIPFISRRLGRRVARRVDPLDVFQEVCLRLHASWDQIQSKKGRPLWALIYRIARNELARVREHHGAKRRNMFRETSCDAAADGASSPRDPADDTPGEFTSPSRVALRKERAEIVGHCLSLLSPQDRAVIEMLDYDRSSTQHTAEFLGISVDAVNMRHYRALRRLRKLVSQYLSGPG